MKTTTLEYYKENYKKIFEAVENPKWRVWKIVDENNIVFQNRTQITTPKRLLSFIRRAKNPQALYVSITEFLNPHKNHGFFWNQRKTTRAGYFYPRAGYIYADCIPLNSYFFVDIDSEEHPEFAVEDTKKIMRYMNSKNDFVFHSLQFSGSKGFHLVYKRKNKPDSKNPINRILHYQTENETLSKKLLELKLKTFDKNHINIMSDVFRVYAAPHSIKAKTGKIVEPLNPIQFLISKVPPTAIETVKVDETKVALAKAGVALAPQPYSGEERDGLSSHHNNFLFVDNMVRGLKNTYVTVIKKHKEKFSVKRLKEAQRTYNLSDFIILELGDYIYAYNFKLVQYKRLIKILRFMKSENLMFFMTRKHTPIPLNGELIDKISSGYGRNDLHSRPHSNMLGIKNDNLVGAEHNRVGKMFVVA